MKKQTIKLNIMRIKFCPRCQSNDIDMVAGGQIGMWQCRNCKFTSPIFPEKEIENEEKKQMEKKK